MADRIERRFFADRCTCGGQYIAGMCDSCGAVDVPGGDD